MVEKPDEPNVELYGYGAIPGLMNAEVRKERWQNTGGDCCLEPQFRGNRIQMLYATQP